MENNNELVRYLIKNNRIKSNNIIIAFTAIDRKDFVSPNDIQKAYEDYPLNIGYSATISQPTTVAFMLEKLAAASGDVVLDIGSGSGWTTALLATIVGGRGSVFGVEIVPELVAFAQRNLSKYKLPNVSLQQADQKLGLPIKAPFDRILVSAGTNELPTELLAQLKVGGILVIPIDEAIWQVKKITDLETTICKYPGFLFVPLQ